MNFNKELLYHFTCEKCLNWWSYAQQADLLEPYKSTKPWYCPHCGHAHEPPHRTDTIDE